MASTIPRPTLTSPVDEHSVGWTLSAGGRRENDPPSDETEPTTFGLGSERAHYYAKQIYKHHRLNL